MLQLTLSFPRRLWQCSAVARAEVMLSLGRQRCGPPARRTGHKENRTALGAGAAAAIPHRNGSRHPGMATGSRRVHAVSHRGEQPWNKGYLLSVLLVLGLSKKGLRVSRLDGIAPCNWDTTGILSRMGSILAPKGGERQQL